MWKYLEPISKWKSHRQFCLSFLIFQVFYDKFRPVKVTLQKSIQDNVFFKCFTFRLTTVVSYLNLEDLRKLFFFSQNCVPLQRKGTFAPKEARRNTWVFT